MAPAPSLEPNDVVVYVAHPEWNYGQVLYVRPNGRVCVSFMVDDEEFIDEYGEGELCKTLAPA